MFDRTPYAPSLPPGYRADGTRTPLAPARIPLASPSGPSATVETLACLYLVLAPVVVIGAAVAKVLLSLNLPF